METLASYIRRTGAKQAELARALGVSPGHLSEILRGPKKPSLTLAVAIERYTGGEVAASSWVPAASEAGDAASEDAA